ncbi:MAG: site-specific integrase [Syntrophaceae bacterium]
MAKKKNPQKQYSEKTKRHATQFPGVYERKAERVIGEPDIVYDITYKKDGKKTWEKIGWRSQGYSADLARQIRNERIITVQHGDDLPKEKKKAALFKEVAKKYMTWAEENKTRAGIDDIRRYKGHIAPRFDNKRMDEISSFDLERFKSDLSKQGLSPASVKHCLVLIRQIYNKGSLWGLWDGKNPILGVTMPTIQNKKNRFLSMEEADILLRTLKIDPHRTKNPGDKKDPQLHDMALLSLHTGMRAGEIFNLRGQDLDFENGLIHISDPKSKAVRKAIMTETVKEMLKCREPAKPNDLVFKNRKRKKIITVSQAFRRTVNDLNLNKGITDPRQMVTFHVLRHTFASWLACQGTPIYTIAQLMGHKSIAMSERYSHLSPDHKKQAIVNLENVIKRNLNEIISKQQSNSEEKQTS